MFNKKINEKIDNLNEKIEKSKILQISYLMGSRSEIIKRNLLAGIAKGVGLGIGITLISAIIVYVLQKIIRLNIPIVGEYIADIVSIVQKSL